MIDIIFEDSDILVCVKPAGYLSEGSGEPSRSLPLTIERERGISSLFAVHRLDREVSGVMVYAKNKAAAASLSAQVADRSFEKEYLAVIEGVPKDDEATLTDLLFKDSKRNKSFVVDRKRAGVKEASLSYKTLAKGDGRALVRVRLHTGRTHQIRVQFGSRGMAVLGDGKYGSSVRSSEIALVSCFIRFKHPRTNKTVEFTYEPTAEAFRTVFQIKNVPQA